MIMMILFFPVTSFCTGIYHPHSPFPSNCQSGAFVSLPYPLGIQHKVHLKMTNSKTSDSNEKHVSIYKRQRQIALDLKPAKLASPTNKLAKLLLVIPTSLKVNDEK
jgi:hypothetical protein